MKLPLLLGFISISSVSASAAEQNQHLDIVVDLADDPSAADLSCCVGNNQIAALTIDLLAADGVTLDRAFVASASLAVSQATPMRSAPGYSFDSLDIKQNLPQRQPTVQGCLDRRTSKRPFAFFVAASDPHVPRPSESTDNVEPKVPCPK